jgi:hypothetical protein
MINLNPFQTARHLRGAVKPFICCHHCRLNHSPAVITVFMPTLYPTIARPIGARNPQQRHLRGAVQPFICCHHCVYANPVSKAMAHPIGARKPQQRHYHGSFMGTFNHPQPSLFLQ